MTISLNLSYIEKILNVNIFSDLKKGRANFDLDHTRAVVFWMKIICESEPHLNKKVLVTAAYAHDWGYTDLFDSSPGIEEVHDKRLAHMEIGAQKIRKLLRIRLLSYFSPQEILRVSHLVGVHDNLTKLVDEDEIALMEADTFGSLDTDFVSPTFSSEDNEKYISQQVIAKRWPKFLHEVAKANFHNLLEKRREFYKIPL